MGNKEVTQFALNRLKRTQSDRTLSGSGGYLGFGTHEVTINNVDLSGFSAKGFIEVTFKGVENSTHRQRIWILDYKDKEKYNVLFLALINSLFEDTTVYEKLDELMADEDIQESVFATFKGMQLKINLVPKKGYTIVSNKYENGYEIVDAITGDTLVEKTFKTINDARQTAIAKNLTRSWPTVNRYEACSDDVLQTNRQNFDFAVQGIKEAKRTIGNPRRLFNPAALRDSAR